MSDKLRTPLQKLAQFVEADGLVCSLKNDNNCLQIFQEDDKGYCYYEVIPWRADPRVPVLYFTRYNEDAEGVVKVTKADIMNNSTVAKFVTATEHPLTALPTFFIHPCLTQEWLEVTSGDWHLWLQHFGRLVGLRI